MQLVEAWKLVVLERYAQFEGRAGRGEFWWFVLANVVVSIVFSILMEASGSFGLLSLVYSLGTIVPSIAVGVRRLHDTGRSGWWYFISFIPLAGVIILIVMWATPGRPVDNDYGPVPQPV